MTHWRQAIRRSNTEAIRKEGSFFPYEIDECIVDENGNPLVRQTQFGWEEKFIQGTKRKVIEWFFEDHIGKIYFSDEFCKKVLPIIHDFRELDDIPEAARYFPKENMVGVFVTGHFKNKKSVPFENMVVIYRDHSLYSNKFKFERYV